MFEYINYGALVLIIFMLLISFIPNKDKRRGMSWVTKGLFVILAGILFEGYYQNVSGITNLKDYKRGNTLKCISGAGVYTKATEYSVSKSDGWSIDKNYFIKDSFMIDSTKCEKW